MPIPIKFSIQTRIEFCFGFESGSRLAETQIQNVPSHIFFSQCQFIYLYTITERHTNNSCPFILLLMSLAKSSFLTSWVSSCGRGLEWLATWCHAPTAHSLPSHKCRSDSPADSGCCWTTSLHPTSARSSSCWTRPRSFPLSWRLGCCRTLKSRRHSATACLNWTRIKWKFLGGCYVTAN